MRDGMPVVALVVAVIALVVAFSGLVSRGTSELEDAPEEAIEKAERRLDTVERQRQAMRKEMAEIAAQAARAIELGSGAGGAKVDTAELDNRVRAAVDAAMRKRLGAEAARVGAPAPKATAQDKFDAMLKELNGTLALEKAKREALHSTLVRLRADLNRVFKAHRGAERERQARLVRSRSDASLRRVLSPAEFDNFAKWRKGTKNEYAKRFFGP
ncbi:MAG: hypothetical protein ACYTKD_22865 [Planctomycetota bacterium]|jgi:hypothetical protein